MTVSTQVMNVNNYLVPAAGQTHAVTIAGSFTATPYNVDWRQFSIDNFPFSPQGVFIDNTQGAGALTVTILPIGYNVVCAAGASIQAQFPAPNGQTAQITGTGNATLYFVDFPVLPNGAQISWQGSPNVSIAGASNNAEPVYVSVPADDGGVAYFVQKRPLAVASEYLALAAASTTASVTPPANSYLRKLLITIPANATLAAAAQDRIILALNGVNVFSVSPFIGTANGPGYVYDVAFDDAAQNVGTGTLVITVATALTTGTIEVNAYFD